MTRNLGWAALSLSMLLSAVGCENSIERQLGLGESCRQQRECKSGLQCVGRLCVAPPQAGTPTTSDEELNANLPVIQSKPIEVAGDAGVDAGADAGPDGG